MPWPIDAVRRSPADCDAIGGMPSTVDAAFGDAVLVACDLDGAVGEEQAFDVLQLVDAVGAEFAGNDRAGCIAGEMADGDEAVAVDIRATPESL